MAENETLSNKGELKELLEKKEENLKQLEKFGKDSNYIKELSDIALIQLQLERYSDSERNYLLCLKHFELQKDRMGQASVYGILGTLFFKKSDYLQSIEFYEKAYHIYNDLMQIPEKIECLKWIGSNLIKLNKMDKACDVFLECSAICSDNNDIYNLLDCLGNLIYIHENSGKWDVVFELYKKTLKAFKEIKDIKGTITSYFNLGIIQKKNDNMKEALRYFKKGTNIAIDSNYIELIIRGLGYIGETLFYLGEVKEAKNQFIKALHLSNKVNAKNAKVQLHILLQSLGLDKNQILDELKMYKESRNKNSRKF
ncbi:MAG: tetratricopeptide repeat protein [Promethearchaeota archaeon]